MPNPIRLLFFAGSARKESYNKRLARLASEVAAEREVEVTFVDLGDLPMPIYHADLEAEQGQPENARKFKALLEEHHGFLISCGEYNSSITPLLKNSIDWATRTEGPQGTLEAFKGKVASLVSASPGRLGGLRALYHVRDILLNIGVHVNPTMLAVSKAKQEFGDDGKLKSYQRMLEKVVDELVTTTQRMHG